MTKNLINYYSDSSAGAPEPLTELRLGAQAAMALLFTPEAQPVSLHYIDDEAVNGYVKCPGDGCPVCYAGAKPSHFDLLPVFDVESGVVKVLRISDNRRPAGLAAKLIPHLKGEGAADKLILISKPTRTDYSVISRPLGTDANRGEAEIQAFSEKFDNGLQLGLAFRAMTCNELAEVPKVAARLGAMGGWIQPAPNPEASAGEAEPS